MSHRAQNLPAEEDNPGESLDIDIEDVWRELDKTFEIRQEIQPGDLTIKMVAERYHVSNEMARQKMNELTQAGVFIKIKVIGSDIAVYRLAK